MEDVFRLRFEVYCREKNFLSPQDYPGGLETDEFDVGSVHFVVYGDDSLPVGYMRAVDESLGSFPFAAHGLALSPEYDPPSRGTAVEISRMMVRSDYRHCIRAVSDGITPGRHLLDPPARNASDLIQLKLVRLAYRHSLERDVRWFFAAFEPTLARKLRMMGFPFRPVGPTGDYFGEVKTYVMDLREMERRLKTAFPAVLSFFHEPSVDRNSRVIRPGEWSLPITAIAA
jgi:N-acyl amino acid synthase of PEP-CTERM/exosortase system